MELRLPFLPEVYFSFSVRSTPLFTCNAIYPFLPRMPSSQKNKLPISEAWEHKLAKARGLNTNLPGQAVPLLFPGHQPPKKNFPSPCRLGYRWILIAEKMKLPQFNSQQKESKERPTGEGHFRVTGSIAPLHD